MLLLKELGVFLDALLCPRDPYFPLESEALNLAQVDFIF
jgi:hypothetical protein